MTDDVSSEELPKRKRSIRLGKHQAIPAGQQDVARAKRGYFGHVLYEVRKTLGLTQGQVGKLADVAVSMISRYEKGVHEPDFGTAALLTTAIALIDKKSGDELVSAISEEMGSNLAQRVIQTALTDIEKVLDAARGGSDKALSSNVGAGLIACTTRVSGDPDSKIEWQDDVPDDPVVFGRDVRAASVVGDSMEPVARDGQQVLYSLEARIRSGDLVIVRPPHSYRKLFKRYHKAPGETALFESLNPNCDPLFFPRAEIEGRMWKVVGVVF